MTKKSMALAGIAADSKYSYVVTLINDNGIENNYVFTVHTGAIQVLTACEKFENEIGSYRRSDLIYKAVNAFHLATQEKYGRPS